MEAVTREETKSRGDGVALGAVSFIAVQFVFALGGYAVHCYLGRRLGPAEYGDFGVAMGLLAWLEVSLSGGFPYAIRKYGAENEALMASIARTAFKGQAIYSVALFAFAMAAAPWVAQLLHDSSLTGIIRIAFADIPVYGAYYSYSAVLNGRRAFAKQSIAMLAYAFAKVAAILLLVTMGFGVAGALVGNIIASIGGTSVAIYYSGRLRGSAPYPIRKLIRYAGGTAALAVGISLVIQIDLFMVKALVRAKDDVGFYTAAGTLARAPFMILLGIPGAFLPAIARAIGQSDRMQVRVYVRQALRLHMLMLAPLTALLAATSTPVIDLVYSSRYASAAPSLAVLAGALMLFGFTNTLYNVMVAHGDTRTPVISTVGMLVLTCVLDFLLVPRFGMLGAAVTALAAAAAGMIAASIFTTARIGLFVVPPVSALRIAAASVVIFILARALPVTGAAIVGQYLLLAALYAGILLLSGELKREDLARLTGRFQRKPAC